MYQVPDQYFDQLAERVRERARRRQRQRRQRALLLALLILAIGTWLLRHANYLQPQSQDQVIAEYLLDDGLDTDLIAEVLANENSNP